MKSNWLTTRFGLNFVAVGIVATLVVGLVIVVQDIAFLVSRTWPKLPIYREGSYLLLATVAVVFAMVNVFTFRAGLPKFVAGIVAISFASYIVQPWVSIQEHHLTILCSARLLGISSLLLLLITYRAEVKKVDAPNSK